jgi:hypothetical protein
MDSSGPPAPPAPPAPPTPLPPRPPRYRLYIDESGDHTYSKLDEVAHRYLALLGVWFRQADDYVAFATDLERFKERFFGKRPDNPVVLHRADIINRKGPFGILCDDERRPSFDAGLLEIVSRARFKMICVALDKQTHQSQYAYPFHPYHYCLATMLERYSGWLNYKSVVGDVMAESRGKEEDLQLKQAYRRVYESGSIYFSHDKYQKALTSRDIKVRPKSANIAGLQLADVLAYPVKQALMVKRGIVPDPGDVFGKKLFGAVEPKFNRNEWRGQVDGYGIKWL